MNINTIDEILSKCPYDIKEQIISYVRSVKYALPEIFSELNMSHDDKIEDKILLVAFLKKFYSIISTFYWTIDNSITSLSKDDIHSIKIGGSFYSMESTDYFLVKDLFYTINEFMKENDLIKFIEMPYYSDIIEMLKNE